MIIREQQIEKQYGFKTCKNKDVPDRFMKGLPSQALPRLTTNASKTQIKSMKAMRDFEELNGLSQSVRLQGSEFDELI